jgi:integrase
VAHRVYFVALAFLLEPAAPSGWGLPGRSHFPGCGRADCSTNRLTKHFARLMDRLAMPEVRFHDLRHAFATNLFKQGVPVKDVSAILGHKSEAFTMHVYQHVLPGASAEVVGKAVTALYG